MTKGDVKRRPSHVLDPPSDWDSFKEQLFQFVAIIAVATVVAFFGITIVEWQKRRQLPFCDSYAEADDSCIPCPHNGKCWEGRLECFPGFYKQGKFCVRDPRTVGAVKEITDFIIQQVCGKYSPWLCKWTGPTWLTESEVNQLVKQAWIDERLGIDAAKFKLAHEEAMRTAKEKLVTRTNLEGMQELQCPVKLLESYKPYWCCIREWILANYIVLLVIFPLVAFVVKFMVQAHRHRKVSARAEQLYLQVCEALEDKASRKKLGEETWVIASHLRDHLLNSSERKRNAVWLLVEQMVCKDSRIDQYPKLIKGESKVVWEWQVEGALRSPTTKSATIK